ncbi:hypothetical protein Sm713_74030 [Streptomyces sp. TS71-3]|nr:hypothetical protein Sm713_74030 [Streptomyces sp. TS71-3]
MALFGGSQLTVMWVLPSLASPPDEPQADTAARASTEATAAMGAPLRGRVRRNAELLIGGPLLGRRVGGRAARNAEDNAPAAWRTPLNHHR